MAGPWKQYKALNGRKYYYNVETKETTWTSPFAKQQQELEAKLKNKKPVFAFELLHRWYLIIYDNGDKLYLHDDQLYKQLSDEDDGSRNQELLDQLDKDKLILLIAMARGYYCNKSSDEVYDDIVNDIDNIKRSFEEPSDMEDKEVEGNIIQDMENGELSELEEDSEKEDLGSNNAMVTEYSSSSEDEDDEEDDEDEDNTEHINKKPKLDISETNPKMISDYKEMFDRNGVDPYSMWSLEMKKCQDDPTFYRIATDHDREEIFEEWCSEYNERQASMPQGGEEEEECSEEEEEDYIPTKYHYLSHIVSKSSINSDTIFEDIKSENKALWKQFRINKIIQDKKEQREFVSKLLFYYKKYTLEQRIETVKEWIQHHRKQHIEDIPPIKPVLAQKWAHLNSNDSTSQNVESLLLSLEHHLLINDANVSVEYYLVGIKDKCQILYSLLVTENSERL